MSTGWIACSGTVTGGKMAPLASRPLPEALNSGTLAVEVIVPRGANGALPILHHGTRSPRIRMLTLHLSIDGRLVLTRIDGANRLNLSIDASEALANGGRLRVIYQWNQGQSLLTLEAPEAGVIRQRAGAGVPPMVAAQLDAKSIGLSVNVFMSVSLSTQVEKALKDFERAAAERPEVMECYLMTGDSDYLLRVAVRDMAALERFILEQLSPIPGVEKIRSSFALKQVRYKTALPLTLG